MPSQHKHTPIRFRPPAADYEWLFAHAAATGRPVNRILAEALAEHRARIEAEGPPADAVPAESSAIKQSPG